MTFCKPNFELLKDAYAIVGGIPESVIYLNTIQQLKGESLSCGTICCAIGWLGHHPKFQALGLRTTDLGRLQLNGTPTYFENAVAKTFNISEDDAVNLFGVKGDSAYDRELPKNLSHKNLWKARMRLFLREHGQLKSQLAAAS